MSALCIPYIKPTSPIARQTSNSDTNIQLFPPPLLCTSSFVPSVLLQSRSILAAPRPTGQARIPYVGSISNIKMQRMSGGVGNIMGKIFV